MLQKSRGIVLKLIPYSDKQKIARIFTEDFGARSMLFSTGGKTGKGMLALLQPLQHGEFVFFSKPEGMDSLRQAASSHIYLNISTNPVKRLQAMFMSEVLYRCLHHHGEDPDLYAFTFEALVAFDKHRALDPDAHLQWLLDLSRPLGFFPEDNYSTERKYFSPAEGCFVSASSGHLNRIFSERESYLLHTLIEQGALPDLNREERNDLLSLLLALYSAHVPGWKELKSPEILAEIML